MRFQVSEQHSRGSAGAVHPALRRVLAEIHAGLRHGYFEYSLTCEVIGQGRRRLILRAGKNYQFVIGPEECTGRQGCDTIDSCDGSDSNSE
jgi:hypothetical protein